MEKARSNVSGLVLGIILACAMAMCVFIAHPQKAHAAGSGTLSDPYVITASTGELKGDNTGKSDIYYLFKTKQASTIKLDYKDVRFLTCGTWKDVKNDEALPFDTSSGSEGTVNADVPKGDIIITFMNDKDAVVKYEVGKFNPGNVKVKFAGGSNVFTAGQTKNYTFTYTKGDSPNTYIDRIDAVSVSIDKAGTYTRKYVATKAGYTSIGFLLNLKNCGDANMGSWYYEPVVVKPSKPVAPKASDISGTQKSLTIDIPVSSKIGNKVMLQMKKGSKWTTVTTFNNPAYSSKGASSKRVTVNKLKANTKYTFRVVGYCPAQGAGKPKLTSPPSKTFTATTAPSDAPSIKSITITGVSQKYHPTVFHRGKWVGNTWHNAWSTPAYYTTTYTAKIKLAKKVKGAKGILVNGVWAKGTGTTFTVHMGDTGALKGKKVALKIQGASAAGIGGPKVTRSVLIN